MKYVAVIDPPALQPTKEYMAAVKLHKDLPNMYPEPKPPKQRERILVGAFNTPYKAAIARNAALKELKFWDTFYNKPEKQTSPAVNRVTTPKKALPRNRKTMIALRELKKNEQRKSKTNTQKNVKA